jgi:cytochrome c peroxidase
MKFFLICITFAISLIANEFDTYINTLKTEADVTEFSSKIGEEIFTSKHIGKDGKEISCTSCHGIDLTKAGENIKSGKKMEPLAPRANSNALTNIKHINKWLRRNFNDVYKREGTAKEKGDVLTYIKNF